MPVATLDELEEDEYQLTPHGRPPGYSSQTVLRFGGLAVNALLDTGATCSAMPQEVAIWIISYAQKRIEEGTLTVDSKTYPITLLHKFVRKARVDGVSAKSPIAIQYALVLKAEFVPHGAQSGPVQDLYFQIFPKGACSFPGVIVGFPVLDCQPFGLGWTIHPTVHTFQALGVSLPRLELGRRAEYRAARKRFISRDLWA